MIGAIAGDIVGSVYEGTCANTLEFSLFSSRSRLTDDTVLTVAVASCAVIVTASARLVSTGIPTKVM